MEKKVSITDIARKVGVSAALVSYVMNGREKEKRVGTETVKKIRRAAEELNYQPNQIARSLRLGSTKTIGLVVADIANPFFGQFARIVEDEAFKAGYTVVFGSSDEDDIKSAFVLDTLLNRQVDGLIVIPTEGSVKQITGLIRRKKPFVLFDRYFREVNCNHIILDNYKGTFIATRHLIEKGHRKIALVAYKTTLVHMKERIRGYTEALEEAGIDPAKYLVEMKFSHSYRDFENSIRAFFNKHSDTEALFCANNGLSINSLYYIRQNCIRIPGDIDFIGFDGGEPFDLYSTPLSFVRQPIEEMGKEVVRLLTDHMNGSTKISHIMLDPELVIRESRNAEPRKLCLNV
ncbi:MAG TPA: LacI family DNA-binding transcriptional regulator [Bacteroidales bacterium]|nr:LacI family DNA-binding transcriptional regulator [Bacteroidales bacterium]